MVGSKRNRINNYINKINIAVLTLTIIFLWIFFYQLAATDKLLICYLSYTAHVQKPLQYLVQDFCFYRLTDLVICNASFIPGII